MAFLALDAEVSVYMQASKCVLVTVAFPVAPGDCDGQGGLSLELGHELKQD